MIGFPARRCRDPGVSQKVPEQICNAIPCNPHVKLVGGGSHRADCSVWGRGPHDYENCYILASPQAA